MLKAEVKESSQQIEVAREEVPRILVRWIRGQGRIDFSHPKTFLNVGQKGSGKSSLLEVLASRFLRDGKVIDLFGSRDNEGLAWLRLLSEDQVLFITGDSVDIKGKWNQVKVKNLRLQDLNGYRVVLSVSAFYGDLEEEFHGLNEIVYKCLYKRTHWDVPWFLMLREASNFIYARIKIARNQHIAKSDFIYLLRESRHMGYSVGVDTIRWTSIDKEVRDVCDYVFVKRVGIQGLPRDLRFVYSYIVPYALMSPPPDCFVLVCARGPLGIGKFTYPFWHKKEKDDLLTELGLRGKIKYGEIPNYGNEAMNWLSDFEHVEIMNRRRLGGSMHEIAEEIHRSSNTVMRHIHDHNKEVKKRGYCVKCRRVSGKCSSVEV